MKILVVDDREEHLKEMITELKNEFQDSGVIGFTNPMMAVKYGYENPVDMVFTAVEMNRLSGFSVARLLRSRHGPVLPVILLTDSKQWRQLGTELHINGWMKRSAHSDQIRHALKCGCTAID